MAVYVDKEEMKFGRMTMCHLFGDTDAELHEMVDKIGVQRKWHQYPGTYKSHYDICLSKRALAVRHGAIEIDRHEVRALLQKRRDEITAQREASSSPTTLETPLS